MLSRFGRNVLTSAALVLSIGAAGRMPAQTQGAGDGLTGQRRPLGKGNDGLTGQPYLIQPGDTIDVTFRYTPEFNDAAVIGPDGRTTLKAAGTLQAAGLTVKELEASIADASKLKLVNPEVAVTLKDFDRPHVFVAGEVNAPGRQELRRPTTALQAILMCGGPKEDAAMGRVLLFRRIDADTAEV
ncbi:MAG TPA: polysaccharide biosynthesis/export family protein, partial [Acidobacteriaceae bacterium]|nr:polysaccharide biosynthesis/export family protein [Acidobacteriaceae bacterium]